MNFKFNLSIQNDLQFSMFSHGVSIPLSKVSYITPNGRIERYSDISNLMAFLKNYSEMPPESLDLIDHCVKLLRKLIQESPDTDETLVKKVSFILEQLTLAKQNPNSRRYSTSFLWSAIIWMKTSPALYKLISDDGFLTLPSQSYLKQLSSSFSLESGLSTSTILYLKERIKHLTDREKTVGLAIDEVFMLVL